MVCPNPIFYNKIIYKRETFYQMKDQRGVYFKGHYFRLFFVNKNGRLLKSIGASKNNCVVDRHKRIVFTTFGYVKYYFEGFTNKKGVVK